MYELWWIKDASAAIATDDDLRQAIDDFSIQGIYGVFDAASQWVLVFGAIIAVIAFGFAGILFLTARGDTAKVETAKKTVTYATVGTIIIVLSRAIIFIIGDFFS